MDINTDANNSTLVHQFTRPDTQTSDLIISIKISANQKVFFFKPASKWGVDYLRERDLIKESERFLAASDKNCRYSFLQFTCL